MSGISDWVQEKVKEVEAAAIDEAKKIYHAVVPEQAQETVRTAENLYQSLTATPPATTPPPRTGNEMHVPPSAPGTGPADTSPPATTQGTGNPGTPTPPAARTETPPPAQSEPQQPWWRRMLGGLFGESKPAGDGTSSDSSDGPLSGIKNFFSKLMDDPIGAIIGLLLTVLSAVIGGMSGIGSLFSGITSSLGFGSDDAPGASVGERVNTAVQTGKRTLEKLSNDTVGQFVTDVTHGIEHKVQVVADGVKHDWNATTKLAKGTATEVYAVGYLVSKGVNIIAATGLAGNFRHESNFNPDLYGTGSEAKGKPGEAYGIGQWHPDRQDDFKKWSGHDIHGSSLNEQLAFAAYELTHKEQHAANKINGAQSPEEAGALCCQFYERAGVPGQPDARAKSAREIYNAYMQQQNIQQDHPQGEQVASASGPLPTNVPVIPYRPAPALG